MASRLHRSTRDSSAFTLIEMLVVIGIIIITTSLTVLSIKGVSGGHSLTGEGDRIAALVGFARQNAMSKNALTALVLVTDPQAGEGTLRAVSIWEAKARLDGNALEAGDWKQISKWERVRPGILFVPPDDAVPEMNVPSSASVPALPKITYDKQNVAADGFRYKLFLPSGGLLGDSAGILNLAEGTVSSGAPVYTNRNAAGEPANTYTITIIAATGHVVVRRP